MDSINFLGKAEFPISSQTMDMLQGMIQLAGTLAILGGPNYILTGCNESEEDSDIVSPGIIVIGGQPYTFLGGNKKDKITIQETKETLIAFGVEYPEARTKRAVFFSDTGEYLWTGFKKVPTNLELKTLFESIKGDAPGTIKMWAGQVSKIPAGYMLCNGDELQKDVYPDLFEVISNSFGGDGLANFKLPDLRGRFIVGVDSSQGSDYNNIGNKGGSPTREILSENTPPHDHIYTDDTNAAGKFPSVGAGFPIPVGGVADVKSSAESSGWGTIYRTSKVGGQDGVTVPIDIRPPYFTLAYIIKVTV